MSRTLTQGASSGWALAWSLARRDLRGGLRGFGIFLACLWLGVTAIAGVGALSVAIEKGLEREGRSLLGGDVELRLNHREASREQLDWLQDRGRLSQVIGLRAMARNEDGKPLLVELKAVDDAYPLYGQATFRPGGDLQSFLVAEENGWGVVVEESVLNRLDLTVGDWLDLGQTRAKIQAVIAREPDRAARGLVFGPTLFLSSQALQATGLVQPGSLVRYHYRLRLPDGLPLVSFLEELERDHPEAGWRILDSRQAVPRINRFINRLTLFLTLIGLAALLVGGLGVGNAIRGYLEGKVGSIATLKCLGAPSSLIFKSYLLQCLLLASIACFVGLMTGGLVPYIASLVLDRSLGWSLVVGLYPDVLGLAGLFGILTALLFALVPLAAAQAISPARLFRHRLSGERGALPIWVWVLVVALGLLLALLAIMTAADTRLASYFVVGAALSFVLFRLTSEGLVRLARRIKTIKNPIWRMAVTNLHRPGNEAGAVVTSLGLGLSLLVIVISIEGNLDRQLTDSLPDDAPHFYFIDIQPDQVDAFEAVVLETPGVRELRRVPMLRGRITSVKGIKTAEWSIPSDIQWVFRGDRGLTWQAEQGADMVLSEGSWWVGDAASQKLVSLDADVGRGLGLAIGDPLTVNVLGRDITVTIANFREIDWSDLAINFVMVFSPGVLAAAPQTHIATVKADSAAADALERAVSDQFSNISAIRVKAALQRVTELLGRIAIAIKAMTAMALTVGILVLAGSLAAGQERRLYDAVILKVLGATRGRVAAVFLIEFGALGLAAGLLAAVIGSIASFFILTEVMSAPYNLLIWPLLLTILGALAVSLLFGFAATYRALGQKSSTILRNE